MTRLQTSAQASDPFADRRATPRVPVALPAFVQADGDRHSAQIVDLSAGGAKLTFAPEIPGGSAIVVDCGGLARAATVRWGHAGVIGISFDRELNAAELAALVERSNAMADRMKARE
jgi:hypothetical protein